ncbi:MAG TPA: CHAT domain-containing protein [Parafilimonas sp.]|nr:CHAT domain-containing protein [Parafilimonas sp.]
MNNKHISVSESFAFSFKVVVILTSCIFFCLKNYCQCPEEIKIRNDILRIENNELLPATQKINAFYILKAKLDSCNLSGDSVYTLLIINICKYEFQAKNYSTAVPLALKMLQTNTDGKKEFSKILQIKNYSLLAHHYDQVLLFKNALSYYDSTIVKAEALPAAFNYLLDARLYKAYIYFRAGDFQKGVEESTIGINLSSMANDTFYLRFLNQRAQSFFYQGSLTQADRDITIAIDLAENLNQPFQLATAYKVKALISAYRQDFLSAEIFFKKAIKERIITKRFKVVASDYNDFGNFYRDSVHVYSKAKACYFKAIEYLSKAAVDSEYIGTININLTKTFAYEHDYKNAEHYYFRQMKYLKLFTGNNFLVNPSAKAINLISNKHLAIAIFQDKTELLLQAYRENHLKEYLAATLSTARLTDSVITQTQHEQTGEQSKLSWRNKTRAFYSNAIEACYRANDPALAFFFFEKSRAVLLNEQLHQLDALNRLPASEIEKQEKFQSDVIEQEQKLSLFSQSSPEYATQQIRFLRAKENLENYIKSLEQKYPAYYQSKYADQVPSLQDIQQYLVRNNQSFVHYFINDTVTYILVLNAGNTKFIRLSQKEFDKHQLTEFLRLCAVKEALNNQYDFFASLSNSIYKQIFQPLQLSRGRIIICVDNALIPFESLCSDIQGKNFLLYDYSFSYVYSARFLMKPFKGPAAKIGFTGFAPVFFEKYLGVNNLKNAAEALKASASYYKSDKLFTYQNATRQNFFNYTSSSAVISIFSHAKADTTDNEPVLFMQDSVIHLSELQYLNNPSTQLVLLSACQTNVGKTATGEGIYSLARGFAAAGIPSVAATLWKADEQAIYVISERFNQYLSEGMNKDEALRKAKLYFIQNTSAEKALPYYWANMILIGNAGAVTTGNYDHNKMWIIISIGIALLTITILLLRRKSK